MNRDVIGETKGWRSACDKARADCDWICCLADYFPIVTGSPWLNCAAAVRVRSTMSLGHKEVSHTASFPEVCHVCVYQVQTAACAEISECFWRFLTLSSITSGIFFQKRNFFSY